LSQEIAHGVRGTNTDLIAYFALRVHALLNRSGQAGLVATNSIAQGDTREIGLDQIVAAGTEIRQAIKSKPWPSKSATLEYAAVWTSRHSVDPSANRIADGVVVPYISSSLDPGTGATWTPDRLVHDPKCADADIAELRAIHRAIDEAVVRAYAWTDLLDGPGLDHGFHGTRQGTRYTIGPIVRQEILDRFLELNHARYAAEVKAGLHNKKTPRKRPPQENPGEQALF
jgi:hypothetical protein